MTTRTPNRTTLSSTRGDRQRPATGYWLDYLRGKNSAGVVVDIEDSNGVKIVIRNHKEGFLWVSTESWGTRSPISTTRS